MKFPPTLLSGKVAPTQKERRWIQALTRRLILSSQLLKMRLPLSKERSLEKLLLFLVKPLCSDLLIQKDQSNRESCQSPEKEWIAGQDLILTLILLFDTGNWLLKSPSLLYLRSDEMLTSRWQLSADSLSSLFTVPIGRDAVPFSPSTGLSYLIFENDSWMGGGWLLLLQEKLLILRIPRMKDLIQKEGISDPLVNFFFVLLPQPQLQMEFLTGPW